MKLNVRFMEQDNKLNVGFDNTQLINTGGTTDYNRLSNRPYINSVLLEGNLTLSDLGYGAVYYDTTENWNLQSDIIAERGAIYIYSDYTYIDDGDGNLTPIAGMKIGDGTSYLIDMPYESEASSTALIEHIADRTVHITEDERAKWNDKVTAYMDMLQPDTLVLSNL